MQLFETLKNIKLFEAVIDRTINLESYLICLCAALICGILCAVAARVKASPTKSFLVSLILLPMIVQTVIMMVNNQVGTGVAVMGAFSLVRFRSVPGKAKDIASIFLAMTAGLACGAGYPLVALLFTAILCVAFVVLAFIPMGGERALDLRITIPESLSFSTAFDDLFKEYTKKHRLVRTKTSNMGSLYILNYKIELKDQSKLQEFIDKLRCRNGNLEISIAEAAEGAEEL